MQTDATAAAALLDDVDELRARIHRDRYPYPLWASLIAGVAVAGALGFLLNDPLVSRSCQPAANGLGGFCVESSGVFNGWWAWVIAAAAAVAVSTARRYRRGMWRPTWRTAVVAVLALYVVVPLLQLAGSVPAIAYPLAAALALGVVAGRRRDTLMAGAAAVATLMSVLVWWRVDADWFLHRNVGLALISFAVAALSAVAMVVWRDQDAA